LLATELASGTSHGHAFPGPHAQQVDLEFGEGGEDIEKHLAHRVGGVVDLPAEGEFNAAGGEVVAGGAGVGHGAGKPVKLRDDEGAAFSDSGEGLVETGTSTAGASQPVVEVDPLGRDTELDQPFLLGGEVLVVGGAASVAVRRRRSGR
jgi:hypothetical protein